MKVEESVKILKELNNNNVNIIGLTVDLSSFSSIKDFSEQVEKICDRIDILIDNAGVFIPPHKKTSEGFEITIGTNAIGTTYLTSLLLPLINKSPKGYNNHHNH